ncbi:MAG: hypothetical protein HOV80_02300 [Polyangiaceae bacterium]|nr:hypothetical protein [Polyangiaceae bacterium]
MRRLLWALIALLLATGSLGCVRRQLVELPYLATTGPRDRIVERDGILYALNRRSFFVYELPKDPGAPAKRIAELHPPVPVEKLSQHGLLLLISTREQTLIFDVADPTRPKQLGVISFGSCDAVAIEKDIAYVATAAAAQCPGPRVLAVFDMKNPTRPELLADLYLTDPRGLAIDGQKLFVSDAREGVVVFDVSDPRAPKLVDKVPAAAAGELIARAGILFISADDGIHQYRYGADGHLELGSRGSIPSRAGE